MTEMTRKCWEHFPHEADIGVRGIGASKEEAFEQAALAVTAVVTDPQLVVPKESVEVACDAPKHQPAVEVKGATCTDLSVRQGQNSSWIAQCVVDV